MFQRVPVGRLAVGDAQEPWTQGQLLGEKRPQWGQRLSDPEPSPQKVVWLLEGETGRGLGQKAPRGGSEVWKCRIRRWMWTQAFIPLAPGWVLGMDVEGPRDGGDSCMLDSWPVCAADSSWPRERCRTPEGPYSIATQGIPAFLRTRYPKVSLSPWTQRLFLSEHTTWN